MTELAASGHEALRKNTFLSLIDSPLVLAVARGNAAGKQQQTPAKKGPTLLLIQCLVSSQSSRCHRSAFEVGADKSIRLEAGRFCEARCQACWPVGTPI